jgi:hypothetical protein
MGLASIFSLSRLGLPARTRSVPAQALQQKPPAAATRPSAPPVTQEHAEAIREAMVAAAAREAKAASRVGLSASMERVLAARGVTPQRIAAAAIMLEFRASDADGPRLALAKAGARHCLRRFGLARSARAIEHARSIAANREPAAAAQGSVRRPERVLAATRRD